jgi:hypothetical protein
MRWTREWQRQCERQREMPGYRNSSADQQKSKLGRDLTRSWWRRMQTSGTSTGSALSAGTTAIVDRLPFSQRKTSMSAFQRLVLLLCV